MANLDNPETRSLAEAVLLLETEEECMAFFEDIFTMSELRSIAQRLEVAKKLSHGKTFNEIVAETGASTTTISRVNRCLLYGTGSYKKIISRIKNKKV